MTDFSKRLSQAIDDSAISQNRIAEMIEATSPSRLTEWKRGKGSPTVAELVRLAKVLDVRLEWLAAGIEPRKPIPPDQAVLRLGVVGTLAEEIVRLSGGGTLDPPTEHEDAETILHELGASDPAATRKRVP